ncbi:hypothetical protein ACFWQC_22155 [Nocardioides sp. NPDC058538]|uniref:hypothetical protein n=1 Tax=Nocardioides sp. NPDC058538 TaxID=3346542 RepID=UPI00365CDD07
MPPPASGDGTGGPARGVRPVVGREVGDQLIVAVAEHPVHHPPEHVGLDPVGDQRGVAVGGELVPVSPRQRPQRGEPLCEQVRCFVAIGIVAGHPVHTTAERDHRRPVGQIGRLHPHLPRRPRRRQPADRPRAPMPPEDLLDRRIDARRQRVDPDQRGRHV